METLLTQVRHIVIWWLFLNSRSKQIKRAKEAPPPKQPYIFKHIVKPGRLSSTIIDLTLTKAHVIFLLSLPVAICWTELLHYFGSEMAANLKHRFIKYFEDEIRKYEIVNFSG